MWRLVIAVVLWNSISTQPLTDDRNKRQTHAYDFVECCPCPGSKSFQEFRGRDSVGASNVGAVVAPWMGNDRTAVVDCPCRDRNADSDGSPTVFFPQAVRPPGSIIRAPETKEDPKPLLHPEVGLASSVLETLRAATDDEYHDALARDAARNDARVTELRESEPETAKNILTIIVNPKESTPENDAMPEASHAQETRCLHPLGAVRPGLVREIERKTPDLNHRNIWDMDSGASNVQEQTVSLNKGLEGLKLKTLPLGLNLLTPKKQQGEHIQSLLKLRNQNKNFGTDVEKKSKTSNTQLGSKVPTLRLPSLLNKDNIKPTNPSLKNLDLFKLKIPFLRKPLGQSDSEDSKPTTSNIKEQFSKNSGKRIFELKTILPSHTFQKKPISLKNLLNLKDVELLPAKKPFTLPGLTLPPLRINTPETNFIKPKKRPYLKSNKNCDTEKSIIEQPETEQRNERIKTKILDTLPSPSENNPLITNLVENKPEKTLNIPTASTSDNIKTKILDVVPSASESHTVIAPLDSNADSTVIIPQVSNSPQSKTRILDILPSASENINFVSDDGSDTEEVIDAEDDHDLSNDSNNLTEVISEESTEASPDSINNLLSKDNDDFDKTSVDGLGLIIDGDENTQIEFEADPEQMREIDIQGFSSSEEEREFNVEVEGFDAGSESLGLDPDSFITENDDMEGKNLDIDTEQNQSFDDVSSEFSRHDSSISMDSLPSTSNQVVATDISKETNQRDDTSLDQTNTEEFSDDNQSTNPLAKDNLMSKIKQRVAINLKTLKNPDTKVLTISKFSRPEKETNSKGDEKSSVKSDEVTNIDPLSEDLSKFPIIEKAVDADNSEEVNSEDLQNLSDALLNLGEEEEENTDVSNVNEDVSMRESSFSGVDMSKASDMESSAATNIADFKSLDEDSEESFALAKNNNVANQELETGIEENISSASLTEPKVVGGEKNEKSAGDSDLSNAPSSEMAQGASESIFSTLPLESSPISPLFRQDIVEPTSLFNGIAPLNPISPLPNLDLKLPTLDEIRKGISNIIGGNERAAEDLSDEFEDAEDCADIEPSMATGASTKNSKSALPNPLENINLDIFQIKPLSQAGPWTPKIPSLNLNTFKTKLPLPKSLDLKPLKLQSALEGKNGGLIGATLTFGPEKFTSHKNKPVSTLSSILNNQGLSNLKNPLRNIPSLEELTSTMRANANSLLSSPMVKQIHSPIEDTLRTSHSLGNSLRSHTENTMRNIQHSLSSSLNEARILDSSKVGGKFAKPEDLLDHLSSAREDMSEKLHAIHIDLNDRLESLHDHIKERTNLPTLRSPLLDTFGRLEDNSLRSSFNKPQTSRQKVLSNRKNIASKKGGFKVRTPKGKVKLSSSSGMAKDESRLRPFKMSKAASSLTPKRVEVPKLTTTSLKPPFSRPLHRDDTVKLKETRPLFVNDQTGKGRKPFKPFGDIKISFETTPAPINFTSRPQASRPKFDSKSVDRSGPSSRLRGTSKSFGQSRFADGKAFASEPKLTRISPSVRTTIPSKSSSFGSESFPRVKASSTLPAESKKSASLTQFRSGTPVKSSVSSPTLKAPTLSLPKPTESPLLSKLRESITIKFNDRTRNPIDKLRTKDSRKLDVSSDMARSASENTEIVIKTEPMKENVSYKCKMVCVRE